ncbi:MAG: SCO family protein [Alphaproteobacteria bacterium]|nr:SCO family protein [Alphaproteobacteria bacterium]
MGRDVSRVDTMDAQARATADTALPVPPDTGKIGGPFALIDQDGKPVTDKDFAGKDLLIYFGYTSCPDMCPTGLQSMSRALDMLGADADKVKLLFITVDPARDTPDKIKEYDAEFSPRIVGLTGTAAQIAAVAKEYQVYYKKESDDEDYVVDHSTQLFLMGPSNNLVTTFDEQVPPQVIVDALHKLWAQKKP